MDSMLVYGHHGWPTAIAVARPQGERMLARMDPGTMGQTTGRDENITPQLQSMRSIACGRIKTKMCECGTNVGKIQKAVSAE